MRYHNITHDDMLNGEGLRTVLWVAGCSHHCKGCQNPITWNPQGGLPFDKTVERELWHWIDMDYCSGLTLSGGDPMYPGNREDIHLLCRRFKKRYPDKTIWMYTGYTMNQIKDEPVLDYVDVVVDGKYIESLRDITRHWCGSTNQVVWRKTADGWKPDKPESTEEHAPESCGCG